MTSRNVFSGILGRISSEATVCTTVKSSMHVVGNYIQSVKVLLTSHASLSHDLASHSFYALSYDDSSISLKTKVEKAFEKTF